MRQRGMRQILTQTRLRTYVTLPAGRCLSHSRVAVDRQDDIVIRAREGSLEAYGLLVERTQKAAYATALGVLRNPSLAEDATQEAFIRAFRRLGDLDEPAAFDGWLRRIVITVALNTRRRQRFAVPAARRRAGRAGARRNRNGVDGRFNGSASPAPC